MLLDIITLLILVILVVSFWIDNSKNTNLIFRHLNNIEEFNQTNYSRVEQIVKQSADISQLVIESQMLLDEKIDEMSKFINEQTTYTNAQQEQFTALVKYDMITARQNELSRTKELKVALERLVSLTTMSRQPIETMDMLALKMVSNRIEELEKILENDSWEVNI